MKEFSIGIDQGTSGTYVGVMNPEGSIVGSAYAKHQQYFPHTGWVEQDPLELWSNACDLLNHAIDEVGINAEEVAGLGIANQGDRCLLEKDFGVLIPNRPIYIPVEFLRSVDSNERSLYFSIH